MKKIILALFILPVQILFAAGPDEMILWRCHSPIAAKGYHSLATNQIYKRGAEAIFLYSNPYRISSLGWNYGAFKYGFGQWGVLGSFRSYTLTGLYNDNVSALEVAVKAAGNLGVAVSCDYGSEKYGESVNYSRLDLAFGLSYSRKNLAGEVGLGRINIKKPYNYPQRLEPQVKGAVDLGDGMIFTAGFKELYTRQGRWFFKQDINIIGNANLELGYQSNPNILQWGLDLSWKSLSFSFIYLAVSRLNDTMVLGLSWGA